MAAPQFVPRNMLVVHCGLVALWLALAIGVSLLAFNLGAAAIRSADVGVEDGANSLARMGASMGDRGQSPADIAKAISMAAGTHGLTASVEPFPGKHQVNSSTTGRPRREPLGYVFPGPGVLGSNPLDPPAAVIHVPGSMVFLTAMENPLVPIERGYAIAMVLLTLLALVVTWFVQQRMLRRALAPVTTLESALRRLAGGEYTRLEMVDREPGEAAVVDAYNAAADELAASVRLRSEAESNLRQFAAEAGHELRTPLTVIMGFVDVLRQGAIAEQALAQRILESVAVEGERMRLLIARLLLLARLDAIAPERHETVDLTTLVAETVDSFRPLAGETKLLSKTDGEVSVVGSTSEFREIVGNLIDNALKYAPGSNVNASVERNGRYAILSVSDDGPGMSAMLRARAFDRFSRGDERGSVPGSGLGLAIVKRIATRAGGDVDLESAPGEGTRVRVRLPLAEA